MDCVLFDMDGVMVDSEDYWTELQREEILPQTVPGEDVEVEEVTGMNYREIYDYLDEEYGTALTREEFVGIFEDTAEELYGERVSLLEGLHELLEELHERDVRTALVSSSPHDWIDIVLERFDLEGEFDAVVSAEDIDGPGKPEPAIFEHAAGELGVSADRCVAVEDSENGVEAAARAGTTVVAYRIDAHGDIDLSPADAVADDPDELREAILARTE
ncbi:HAD family hydrolase [Halalkalicoccus ordinarius]|uniref:HAD family hydrolase n=1 Tax=Halalkalicoccus ordinarius TaxID=3116651 RepID=UPI00300ECE15